MLTYALNSVAPATRLSNVCTAPVCSSISAEILDVAGRINPFPALNGVNQYQKYGHICNYELAYRSDGLSSWLNGNTLAALQSNAIWWDDDSCIPPVSLPSLAQLNQWREILTEKLESATSIYYLHF
jgi:hypothetical protein